MKIYKSTNEVSSEFACGDIIARVDRSTYRAYQRYYFDIVVETSYCKTVGKALSFWPDGIYFDMYSSDEVDYQETEARYRKDDK